MSTSPLMTRQEAAAYLCLSESSFDRHVRPSLTPVRLGGTLVRYERTEVEEWLESRRAGNYEETRERACGGFASPTTVSASSAALERQIDEMLSPRPKRSTRASRKGTHGGATARRRRSVGSSKSGSGEGRQR